MITVLRLSTSLVHIKIRAYITSGQLWWLRSSVFSTLIFPEVPGKCLTSASNNSLKKAQRNYILNGRTGAALGVIALKHFDAQKVSTKFYRFLSTEGGDNSIGTTFHKHISSYDENLNGNLGMGMFQNEVVKIFDPDEMSYLPEMSRTVYNLAPYVQKSETLQNLVQLGVNLSKIEKIKGIASLLLMADFDKDILPYLHHLLHVGVAPNMLGHILSVNPMILNEYLEDLEQRVGYMIFNDFTMQDVASMYTRAPVLVSMDPVRLDNKFRYLQQAFGISEHKVRQVVLTFPKILPWRKEKIDDMRVTLENFMGFEDNDLKLMLLREPKLFTANRHNVWKTFDYIHNTMLIPHSLIIKWPSCLRSRLNKLKGRHLFLVHVGRAQYDPCKENYVSLKGLLECTDNVFCINVARSTEIEFKSFLKTL